MKKIFITLIIILSLPLTMKAETYSSLNCPDKSSPGKTINCQLTITTETQVRGIKAKYKLPNIITYNNLSLTTDWTNHYSDKNGLVATKKNNYQKENNLGNLTLKIKNNAHINKDYVLSLTDIEISNINHNLISIEDITTNITLVSNDNTLSQLTLTNGTLTPKFTQNTLTYKSTINNPKTIITAIANDTGAKVSGDIGEKNLNYGANLFKITVTSSLGEQRVYTIIVKRPLLNQNNDKKNNFNNNSNTIQESNTNSKTTNKSSDASLKELSVKNYKIDFHQDKFTYDLTIDNSVTSIDINAIANDPNASVEIDKTDDLQVGENTITIIVTAEDGTICKYILNINRKEQNQEIDSDGYSITEKSSKSPSNKKISIFPKIPVVITIIIVIFILIILIFIKKRISPKEN